MSLIDMSSKFTINYYYVITKIIRKKTEMNTIIGKMPVKESR